MNVPMEDKVCVVTGGGSGRGKVVAEALVRAGARAVAITYRENRDEAHRTYLDIQGMGAGCLLAQMDVTHRQSVRKVLLWIQDQVGHIDVFVNAETEEWPDPLEEADDETRQRAIDVNLRAPLLCADEILPFMSIQTTGGVILTVGVDPEMAAALKRIEGGRSPMSLVAMMDQVAGVGASRGVSVQMIPPGPDDKIAEAVVAAAAA